MKEESTTAYLIQLEGDGVDGENGRIDQVGKAVGECFGAGDAVVISQSLKGPTKIMTVVVSVFEAAGLTVFEKKTMALLF